MSAEVAVLVGAAVVIIRVTNFVVFGFYCRWTNRNGAGSVIRFDGRCAHTLYTGNGACTFASGERRHFRRRGG